MQKRKQGGAARPGGTRRETPSRKIAGSLRSQRSIRQQWRLELELKSCKANIGMWERRLATAQEGKARQARQISGGQGSAHRILAAFVQEATEAEGMIATFRKNAEDLQRQIETLTPSNTQVAERFEHQQILGARLLARLELDRKLDLVLDAAREILQQRAALTAEMTEEARALDFAHGVDLDSRRFESLALALPVQMASDSEKFVEWFLGGEKDRSPQTITGGEFILPETLASHNAFRSGDCVSLTPEEGRKLDAQEAARRVPAPEEMQAQVNRAQRGAVETPSAIQWGLPRP
jgi:hypothetical protein